MEALHLEQPQRWQNLSADQSFLMKHWKNWILADRKHIGHCLALIQQIRLHLDNEVVEQINIAIKYDGYISRQKQQVEHFQKME